MNNALKQRAEAPQSVPLARFRQDSVAGHLAMLSGPGELGEAITQVIASLRTAQ